MPEPLRLYRWQDAPPEFRALSDHGGGEVLVAVVPKQWMEDVVLSGLPWVLGELLEGDCMPEHWWHVQRVPLADGTCVVIVAKT